MYFGTGVVLFECLQQLNKQTPPHLFNGGERTVLFEIF